MSAVTFMLYKGNKTLQGDDVYRKIITTVTVMPLLHAITSLIILHTQWFIL